jgi:hypothetical protein
MKAFQCWLSETKNIGHRSCSDVLSRLKRASSFIDIDSPLSDEELLFHLSVKEDFKKLTRPVKSQLKRAVTLYREHKFNNPR